MKNRTFKWLLALSVSIGCVALISGCSSCKPGKPGPIGKYNVEVRVDESLKSSSVIVDVVGVNSANLQRWEAYDMSRYWRENDPMRRDADKVVLSFVSSQTLSNSLPATDPKWEQWKAKGVTHILVLADLPSAGLMSKNGSEDARRQILPLDKCNWPSGTKTLSVQIQRSGIVTVTPLRFPK
jgi:hypothetical protein